MATPTDARERVLAARAELGDQLQVLDASGRAAVDIPAKIKRSPAKAAAVAGGLGFLALKGPQRVFGLGRRAVRGKDAALPKSMLPDEIEKTLRKMGSDGDQGPGHAGARLRRLRPAGPEVAATASATCSCLSRLPAARPARREDRRGLPVRAGSRARSSERLDGHAGTASTAAVRAASSRSRRRRRRTSRRPRRPTSRRPPVDTGALDSTATGEWRNGRRAGLRSRCRVSGVEVRPLSRLPALGVRRRASAADRPPGTRPILRGRCRSPEPPPPSRPSCSRSRSRPSAWTRPSTRPSAPSPGGPASPASGRARRRDRSSSATSAPASSSTRPSTTSCRTPTARRSIQEDILPLANADVEVVQAEEGKPLIFKATVPVRPEVELGDYRDFPFGPEIEAIDDARVDQVIEELRDQNATLAAVEDRGAKDGDYAVISFVGHAATASRSRAARPTGCRSSSARSASSRASRRTSSASRSATRPSSTSPSRRTTASPAWPARPPTSRSASRSCARRSSPSSTTTSWPASATSPTFDALRDGHPHAPRGQRPRPRPPRLRRPDHRVRRGQRHGRPARRAHRPGGRGHARRVPRLAGPPGHHRGGLPQGHREDRRRPARRLPTQRRAPGQDPARALEGRRRRGRRGPRRGRRGGGRPGREPLRRRRSA